MADQNTCIRDGEVYDAVEVPAAQAARGCDGCDRRGRLCRNTPPCTPSTGRTDGRFVVWQRRIGSAPVEGALP